MDKTLIHPVIVLAKWFQFGTGERIVHLRVLSRMLVWCRTGLGRVRINGDWYSLAPDQWLLLPWAHAVEYEPDARRPFFVGGIHLIPDYRPGAPVAFGVSHRRGDYPDLENDDRRDAAIPGLTNIVRGHFADAPRLGLLATYIVEHCIAVPPREEPMRSLASLLLAELQSASSLLPASADATSRLTRMQQYIRRHLVDPLAIGDLARIAECSPATVHRLFLKSLKVSPLQWHAQQRIAAARALLGGSSMAVREVAARVGFEDPYHFSRFFKRHTGTSPRAYRQHARLM